MPSSSAASVAGGAARDRVIISICIATIVALAWAYLFHLDRQMSASMEHDVMMEEMGMSMDMPWTSTDVWLAFVMWTVMMIGMMTGTAAPVLLLFASARSRGAARGVRLAVLLFATGYLTIWAAFSAVAAIAQWRLHEAALLSPMMAAASRPLAGAILMVAGIYQLTPFKGACLAHCRSPLGFLMTHWRDGAAGAFRMGLGHGLFCLGCCWALMLVLFVVGVMNLIWVAALTTFVLLEKVVPGGRLIGQVGGGALIAAGLLMIVRSV
jgi:predicted metal-binding membrane protein